MQRRDPAIARFELRLREALDAFACGLKRHLEPEGVSAFPMPGRAEDLRRLEAEDARLRRKARRGAPCYDLNRHIAVRRRLAMMRSVPSAAG